MGWWDSVMSVLLPDACAACDDVLAGVVVGDGGVAFCARCWDRVLELDAVGCRLCSEPGRFHRGLCGRCTVHRPEFGQAWSPFEHEGAMARAIHRFKYEDRADLARPLAGLISSRLGSVPLGVLVPIPLHGARFRARRFDQAALLAVELGKKRKLSVEPGWLERVRDTPRQVGLSETERITNVDGAFRAGRVARGAVVTLVDDVYTTGATARESARVLARAGATVVSVVTVARARRTESLA